jgi:hypothetical protein
MKDEAPAVVQHLKATIHPLKNNPNYFAELSDQDKFAYLHFVFPQYYGGLNVIPMWKKLFPNVPEATLVEWHEILKQFHQAVRRLVGNTYSSLDHRTPYTYEEDRAEIEAKFPQFSSWQISHSISYEMNASK